MPWTKFICPDGEQIDIDWCLAQCRMEGRCVARPTLEMFKRGRREWKGVLSTTAALNGTRLEYLKLKHDYGESPCSRAFALVGTFHHMRYQKMNLPETLQEEWMEDELGSGMFDFWENNQLYDFKCVGGWKICRWLGKYKIEEPTGIFYKSGPRKGQEKMRKVWGLKEPDMYELQLQLSRYAHMIMDAGFPVEKAWVQATVRDYTAMTARMYGLSRQIYLIEVPILDRDTVVNYFQAKQKKLHLALETNTVPDICLPEERWEDDRRCRSYCPVRSFCDYGANLKEEEESNGEEQAGPV